VDCDGRGLCHRRSSESAIAEGRKYQREKPDRAVGFYAIEGDASVLRQWPEAAAAFGKALARQPCRRSPFVLQRCRMREDG
jgi:hypothetical protein